MYSAASAGTWAAIVLAALTTGILGSRWSTPDTRLPRLVEGLLLGAAAAAVIAWFSNAGAVLASPGTNALLGAYVPIEVGPAFRLGVLWATLPGASLTFASILLVWTALSGANARAACIASGLAATALILAAWFAPHESSLTNIPPFVQAPAATLAPLFALLALTALAIAVTTRTSSRVVLLLAWIAATAAVASEQVARSQLGIGPRDPIVFGSASSGLVLWLIASALLHRRVQSLLFRSDVPAKTRSSPAAWIGHFGAALIAISFAAHAVASRSNVSLPQGSSVTVNGALGSRWQLVNQGVSRYDAEGVFVTALAIEARTPRGRTALLTPEIREYHGRDGQHLAPVSFRASHGRISQAVRVLFIEADSLDVASVRVTFLPAPILWTIGLALLAMSALLALSVNPRSRT